MGRLNEEHNNEIGVEELHILECENRLLEMENAIRTLGKTRVLILKAKQRWEFVRLGKGFPNERVWRALCRWLHSPCYHEVWGRTPGLPELSGISLLEKLLGTGEVEHIDRIGPKSIEFLQGIVDKEVGNG